MNCVWDGVLHVAITHMLCIVHLLLRARFVMTPASSIKLCAIWSYRLFHSHAQVIISYWLNNVNRSISKSHHLNQIRLVLDANCATNWPTRQARDSLIPSLRTQVMHTLTTSYCNLDNTSESMHHAVIISAELVSMSWFIVLFAFSWITWVTSAW